MTAEEARQLADEYERLSEASYARLWRGRKDHKDLKQVAFSQAIVASSLRTVASNLDAIAECRATMTDGDRPGGRHDSL